MSRLALAALAAALSVPSSAQVLTDDALFRSRVWSATRLTGPGLDASRVPAAVRVLGREELDRLGARTLGDALQRLPRIVAYDQVGNPLQPTLDMRGWNATPVPSMAVFIDGARVNEADFGQVNWQLIPVSQIDRVEVLPGPSAVYGQDAVSGVVNVYTRRGGTKAQGEAWAGGGSYGRAEAGVAARGPLGPADWAVEADHQREDGFRRGAPSRITQTRASLGRRGKSYDTALTWQFADDRLDQGGSITAGELARDRRQSVSRVKTDNLLHALTWNGKVSPAEGWSLSGHARWRKRLENTPLNRGRTSTSRSRALMETGGAGGQAAWDGDLLGRRATLAAGAEAQRAETASMSASPGFLSHAFVRQWRGGAWTQAALDLIDSLTATAAWRYDRAEYTMNFDSSFTTLNDGTRLYEKGSPSFGLNWNPLARLGFRAFYGQSYRTPTGQELIAIGPFASSPDLRPVTARTWEGGARWTDPAWGEAEVSAYRTMSRDEIYAVYDPTQSSGSNRNVDKVRRQGVEAGLRPRLGPVDASLEWAYTDATFQTQFVLDKAPFPATQLVRVGAPVPMVPRHAWTAGASVRLPAGLRVGGQGRWYSGMHLFGDEAGVEPRVGPRFVADAEASWDWNDWSVSGRVENALDRRYETRGILASLNGRAERFLVPAPGRTFGARVSRRF